MPFRGVYSDRILPYDMHKVKVRVAVFRSGRVSFMNFGV